MTKNVIETVNISKIYKLKGQKKEIRALNKVNLSIKEGEKFGLLGPNGAGKTTLIHILTTIKQPTSGYALLNGNNIIKKPKKAKAEIALMLNNKMLYYRITAYDNLKFFCKIYNINNYKQKIYERAEEFELTKWLNQYVETFSTGMRMKLALLKTVLLERNILLLDEPSFGLDVKSTNFVIKKLKNLDKTILLTSHDMRVVERVCDRIAFIDKGNIIKIGTQDEISQLIKSDIRINVIVNSDKDKLKLDLEKEKFVKELNLIKDGLSIIINGRNNYSDLLSILSKYKIYKVTEVDFSLEDIFLKII